MPVIGRATDSGSTWCIEGCIQHKANGLWILMLPQAQKHDIQLLDFFFKVYYNDDLVSYSSCQPKQ